MKPWNFFKEYRSYLLGVGVTLAAGALSSLFVVLGADYGSLEKPPLSPPAVLFPIAWTLLYILMGIGLGRILGLASADGIKAAIKVYAAQLAVNILWPFFFFTLQLYLFSFVWLTLLLVLVIAMLIIFYAVRREAAVINIPYLIWLLFAGYLNFGVLILNG